MPGPTLEFIWPRRHRVVFIGSTGESLLKTYVAENDIEIYVGPRAKLNVWIAILAILSGRWGVRGYYRTFLRFTRPRFVITFEDNALEFYDPVPRLVAWSGFDMPMDAGPEDVEFLDQPILRLARDAEEYDAVKTPEQLGQEGEELRRARQMLEEEQRKLEEEIQRLKEEQRKRDAEKKNTP